MSNHFPIGTKVKLHHEGVAEWEGIVGDFDNPDPPPCDMWPEKGVETGAGKMGKIPILLPETTSGGFLYSPYYVAHEDQLEVIEAAPTSYIRTFTSNSICPVCGKRGDDLVFAFYCSDQSCSNYRG